MLRCALTVVLIATANAGSVCVQTPGDADSARFVPPSTPLALEDRKYSFQFSDVTYRRLLEYFALRAGLELVGEGPPGSTSFDFGVERVDFETALNRMRVVLNRPRGLHVLRRDGDKLRVQSVMCTLGWSGSGNVFIDLDSFERANKEDHEIAVVRVLEPSHERLDVAEIALFLPSYVRIVRLSGDSSWSVFGISGDIRRYVPLGRMLTRGLEDDSVVASFAFNTTSNGGVIDELKARFHEIHLFEPLRTEGDSDRDLTHQLVNPPDAASADEICVWRDDAFRRLVISCSPEQMESVAGVLEKLE